MEKRTDTERLDWLLDDLQFDEIGGVDVHEEASRLAASVDVFPPGIAEYNRAYRNAIDAAMDSGK